jgi:hypothetical protein
VYASYTRYLSDPARPRPPTKEDAGRPGHQRRRRPPRRRSLNTTIPSSEGTRGLHRVAGYDPPWTSSPPLGPGGRFPLDGVQHRNTLTRPLARRVQTTSTEGRASCYRSTNTPARKPGAPSWLLVEASLSPRGWDGGIDLTRDGRTGEIGGGERRGRGWGNMRRRWTCQWPAKGRAAADLLMAGDGRSGGGPADGRRREEQRRNCRWPATGGAAAYLPMAGDGRSGGRPADGRRLEDRGRRWCSVREGIAS